MSGRIVAVVPAYDEEAAIAAVVAEIHAVDPAIDVVVVDDGSTDATSATAAAAGAAVVRLPFNLGIGAAVQTGFRYALEHGYDVAVRLDGDGQHDATELPKLLGPLERDEADVVTGSRFRDADDSYRPPLGRRLGITWFAKLVSLLARQRVTDTTSGFQALNGRAIALFARDYPSDYPEVEATVLLVKHRLRLLEVPVTMREREHGSSSITLPALRLLRVQGDARPPRGDGAAVRGAVGGAPVTPVRISIAAGVGAALLLLIILELIRGRRLKERYALLWLVTGLVLLVLSVWRGGLNTIAGWLGVQGYPPAILFAAAIMFVIAVLLHYSTVLSRLTDDNVLLAQEVALLRARLDALERRVDVDAAPTELRATERQAG